MPHTVTHSIGHGLWTLTPAFKDHIEQSFEFPLLSSYFETSLSPLNNQLLEVFFWLCLGVKYGYVLEL